ncbi:MAG: hypothetical protein IJ736_04660 [Firmicutes bacterium]|nr:hypothetical protein [Bacillota bacterium]
MDENNKKVIMVDGNGSKWFEKAIFIVGEGRSVPNDILTEAEMIINNYFQKKYKNHAQNGGRENYYDKNYYDKRTNVKKKAKKWNFGPIDAIMLFSMLLCIVLMVMVVNF